MKFFMRFIFRFHHLFHDGMCHKCVQYRRANDVICFTSKSHEACKTSFHRKILGHFQNSSFLAIQIFVFPISLNYLCISIKFVCVIVLKHDTRIVGIIKVKSSDVTLTRFVEVTDQEFRII